MSGTFIRKGEKVEYKDETTDNRQGEGNGKEGKAVETFIEKDGEDSIVYKEVDDSREDLGTFITTSVKEVPKKVEEPLKEQEEEESLQPVKEDNEKIQKQKIELPKVKDTIKENKKIPEKGRAINFYEYGSGVATMTGSVAIAMGVRDLFLISFTVLMGLVYLYSKRYKVKNSGKELKKKNKLGWVFTSLFLVVVAFITFDNIRYASMAFSIYSEEEGYTVVNRCTKEVGEKDRRCLHDGEKVIVYQMDGISVKSKKDITEEVREYIGK